MPTPTLSIAIIGVPKRLEWIRQMQSILPTYTTLHMDTKHEGCWKTTARGWAAFDPKCSHHLVIEDDLLLCKDFALTLPKIIEAHPDDMISLWGGKSLLSHYTQAHKLNSSFFSRTYGTSGQANILPTSKIIDLLKFSARYVKDDCVHDDVRLRLWQHERGLLTYNTVPELMSHIGWSSTVSRFQNFPMYQDADWIGEEKSSLSIDWTLFNPSCAHTIKPYEMDRKYLI